MKMMKKVLALTLALIMVLSAASMIALAEPAAEPVAEKPDMVAGATAWASEESPTGYTVTFAFDPANYDGEEEITSMQLVGNFTMYWENENGEREYFSPYEWQPGMVPCSSNHIIDMAFDEATGLWFVDVPLPNTIFLYNYRINGSINMADPVNPPMTNPNNGHTDPSSPIRVPFDPEKQVVDLSLLMPRTDGKTGTILFDSYIDVLGEERPVGIYLPYGYDADREEPYKVLYMYHGGGGNEIEWVYHESAPHLFDNLIAAGELEETIIVSIYHQVYAERGFDYGEYGDRYNLCAANLKEKIFPLMEEKYNASSERFDRAVGGPSMGGMMSSSMFMRMPEEIGYGGFLCGANENEFELFADKADVMDESIIYFGAGKYDFGYKGREGFSSTLLMEKFDAAGIDYHFGMSPNDHDMHNNNQLFYTFATKVLWKDEADIKVGKEAVNGAEVNKDPSSPTGYSVTFTYEGNTDAQIAQTVAVRGDFEMYREEGGKQVKYSPFDWEPGMENFGGTNYTIPMTRQSDGVWTVTVPLPSNAYRYHFLVNGKQVQDPVNKPILNPLSGNTDPQSMFFVPYDGTKQPAKDDNSILMPRTDEKVGQRFFDSYTNLAGETGYFGVYLPYGFDADREEPYKVMYMCHGGGGNEVEWLYHEAAPNVLDNMIAAGEIEDTIIISLSYGVYNDTNVFADNLVKVIIPQVEETYNASGNPKDRALGGVSMGSMTTCNVYYRYPTEFGYIAAMTGAASNNDLTQIPNIDHAIFFIGGGKYDFAYNGMPTFSTIQMSKDLEAAGVDYTLLTTPYSHDFFNNTALSSYFIQNVLWKDAGEVIVNPGETFTVPVTVRGEDVAALDTVVNYNEEWLTLDSIEFADGFMGVIADDRILAIAENGGLGYDGDVVVAYATFTANADLTGYNASKIYGDGYGLNGETVGAPEEIEGMLPIFVTITDAVKGDINGDGVVTLADALMAQQIVAGNRVYDVLENEVADMDDDGNITVADVMLILQEILK